MNLNDIKHVMVVGAGTMGHSIAQVYGTAGYEVDLVDLSQETLDHAIKLIRSNLETLAEFNRVSIENIPSIIKRINTTTNLGDVAPKADLVIEAVYEDLKIKGEIFSQLDKFCSENAILASNTSGLDVFRVAKVKNLERVVIHHWFAPPHIIPLVEVVKGRKTSPEIIDFSVKLLEKLGKQPIVMNKFARSFIVNKIQSSISVAVYELLMRKLATPEQIDLAVKTSLGIRLPIVGVVQTQDFTGLDLVVDVARSLGKENPLVQEMVDRGDLGAKSGKGFYDYGGRSEEEILRKRDKLYLQMLDHLEKTKAFERI
ncbi:MAG: 3-hydroxyacyl-CoA dehydrogenase family protein [Promethearchaeota archaeon]|nr:MAG: 3-hydroxyacyl-CoA dehydrogenase family protein [Candidatus Lokiarchaeota archaeon]